MVSSSIAQAASLYSSSYLPSCYEGGLGMFAAFTYDGVMCFDIKLYMYPDMCIATSLSVVHIGTIGEYMFYYCNDRVLSTLIIIRSTS